MPRLKYVALTALKHGDQEYEPGSDISHFAPLLPTLESHISVGRIQLVDEHGNASRPRLEVRTNPTLFAAMRDDIRDAQAQGADAPPAAHAEETPSGDEPSEPAADEFDPAEHTIPVVLEYVEENPDALDDVIALEAGGKARSTLLAKLEALAGDDE